MTRARPLRPHTVTRVTVLALTAAATFLLSKPSAAQPVATLELEQALSIPPNLQAPAVVRSLLDTMWRHSPTFRAQCSRLRRAALLIDLHLDIRERRARTEVVNSMGRAVRAEIYINHTLGSLVELIAHEMEHIVEQLDDVQLAADDRHGVSRSAGGAFETARAVHIGQKVAGEVDRGMNQGSRLARR